MLDKLNIKKWRLKLTTAASIVIVDDNEMFMDGVIAYALIKRLAA